MNLTDHQLSNALQWIASLPLLGDAELAELLGIDESDARRLREELTRRGWVEWVAPRGGGRQARPLMLVREEALAPLAERLGIALVDLSAHLPVTRAAVLERIARGEVMQGVNRVIATVASQLRESGDAEVETALSLPLALPAGERWWSPRVEAHLRLRVDGEVGACFVAWDRAGAPDQHRRQRVREWFEAVKDIVEPHDLILVACAGERELRVWEEAVSQCRERTDQTGFDVLLVLAADLLRDGALDVSWRAPASGADCRLLHWLDWRRAAPRADSAAKLAPLPNLERTAPNLRTRLMPAGVPRRDDVSIRERIAALSLALDPHGHALLEWVARHPWLTAGQLATLLNDPEHAVRRRLGVLLQYGTVRSIAMPDVGDDLWIATCCGLRPLAAADQVPLSRYKESGGVKAPASAQGRPSEVVKPRAFAHELGVNRAFVRLAETARRKGGRLAVWRNEAESTHVFHDHGGRWWVRPDGSGVMELNDGSTPLLLEYDRGTLSRSELRTKLVAYRRYYSAHAWEDYFDAEPLTLWVCSDHRAARRVLAVVRAVGSDCPAVVVEEQQLGTAMTSEERRKGGYGRFPSDADGAGSGEAAPDRPQPGIRARSPGGNPLSSVRAPHSSAACCP